MEKRNSFMRTDLNIRKENKDLFIEGYFILFNRETNLYDDIYEEVAPGSLFKSLKTNDIRSLFNHDTNLVLGRTSNKTLKLNIDSKGLWGKVEINQKDSQAMSVYQRVKRGDVTGCSFGFYPVKEEITERKEGGTKFILTEIDLFEVSFVTFPAYPQTEISARKKTLKNKDSNRLELKKQKLKEKIKIWQTKQ